MFEFFDAWGRVWYPDSWVNQPGFVLPMFVVGVLSFFGVIWAARMLLGAQSIRGWKLWFALGFLGVFIWTLPVLLAGIVGIVIVVLALAFMGLALWFMFTVWANSDDSEGEEKYIVKKEGGREVVYEKGFFDKKVGELHEGLGGSKETRTIFGPNVKVDKPSIFSTERKGEVEGQKGVFKKGVFDRYPTFYDDEQSEEDEDE